MITQNLPKYWDRLYQKENPEWILQNPHPNLANLFKQTKLIPKSGRVLVPGAGYGHDAAYWAKLKYDVVALDFSQMAYSALLDWAKEYSNFSAMKLDIFELQPENTTPFNVVYESGFFVALHPGKRDEYFEVWLRMLAPNGIVISHFHQLDKASNEGPPHTSTTLEIMARIDGLFDVVEKIPVKKPRPHIAGTEEIWILKKI